MVFHMFEELKAENNVFGAYHCNIPEAVCESFTAGT